MPFYPSADPNFVVDDSGRQIPTSAVDPADIVQASAPAPVMEAAPAPDMSSGPPAPVDASAAPPALPDAAATPSQAVSKLDHPAIAGGLQLASESVTSGLAPGLVKSLTKSNNDAYGSLQNDVTSAAEGQMQRKTDFVNNTEAEVRARQTQAQQDMDANRQKYIEARKQEQTLRDQSDPAIDPDQFMRDNGLGVILLAALAGGIGGGQHDNGQAMKIAMDTIDKRIDQNIAAQKSQIESGRIRRGNMIEYYQRQGFDAKEAESAARAMYYAQADRYTQLEAQRAEIPNIGDNAKILSGQLQLQLGQANQAIQIAGQSHVTKNYAHPVAEKTKPEDIIAALKIPGIIADIKNANTLGNIVGENLSPEGAKELKSRVQEVAPALAKTEVTFQNLTATVQAAGGTLDEKTGKITWPTDLKGVGPVDRLTGATPGVTTDHDKLSQAQGALVESLQNQYTGANASPEQRKVYEAMAGGSGFKEDQFKSALEKTAKDVTRERSVHMARLGDDGMSLYNYGKRQASTSADTSTLVPR